MFPCATRSCIWFLLLDPEQTYVVGITVLAPTFIMSNQTRCPVQKPLCKMEIETDFVQIANSADA